FSSYTSTYPHIYALSLHDALPICARQYVRNGRDRRGRDHRASTRKLPVDAQGHHRNAESAPSDLPQNSGVRTLRTHREGLHLGRSEEHTSELQSRENLVCRLLLEK